MTWSAIVIMLMVLVMPLALRDVRWYLWSTIRKRNLYFIWQHPSLDEPEGLKVEFRKEKEGKPWRFGLLNQPLYWLYEKDDKGKEGVWTPRTVIPPGEDGKGGTMHPFQVYDKMDWARAARLMSYKQPLLEKIQGWAMVVLAFGGMFGIFALIDMAGKSQ